MTTPWGMIRARQEASQARGQKENMHEILVKLVNAMELALKDLPETEASTKVREKLQKAIKNAQDDMRREKLA